MAQLYRPAFVHNRGIEIVQGQDWLQGYRFMASNINGTRYLLDTTGCTAALTIRSPDPSGDVQLAVTTDSGELVVGASPARIERSTAYVAGQWGSVDETVYECGTGGTTSGGPVIFDDTIGMTTTDGTVVWQCIARSDTVCNLTIVLPAAMTAGLSAWGRGVYSLELFDSYGHSVAYIDGLAVLRAEATY